MFRGKIKHIHFVGIGGSGMSGNSRSTHSIWAIESQDPISLKTPVCNDFVHLEEKSPVDIARKISQEPMYW